MSAPAVPLPRGARPVWAEIDLDALRHNVSVLRRAAAPAAVCAVVKADAYGHGAVAVGRAALEAGATWLAVATVEEGVELRRAGVSAPVLLLSEPTADAADEVVAHRLTPTVYTPGAVAALAGAAERAGAVVDVHVKVDTGMHRVGARRGDLPDLVRAVRDRPVLRFAALWTHFPVADTTADDDRRFTEAQITALRDAAGDLAAAGLRPPLLHAANSAGAVAYPAARLDLVRCGISLYGTVPFPLVDERLAAVVATTGVDDLKPVLSLKATVAVVRRYDEGTRPSYGRMTPLAAPATVATVPLGYADGVPRRYFTGGGTVLVGGRRRPLAGMVTMDQIVVDCGDDDVAAGDEVVLIGEQGPGSLTASEWAAVLGTIPHEVLCGIGKRVPRVVVEGGRAR